MSDNSIALSILIPSTHTRWDNFGASIQKQIWGQYAALPRDDQDRVEIIVLTENKTRMLGDKRNIMVDMAQGDYVAFVDDDDTLEPDYLESLLRATDTGADVITFLVSVTLNGGAPQNCHYSMHYEADHNSATMYHRLPNHICCVKRGLASAVSFPHLAYQEDAEYAKLLKPLLTSEHAIDRVLYHYAFSSMTSETQVHMSTRPRRREAEAIMDVVMLSSAGTDELREMTQRAIDSCIAGANSLPINVLVMEQQPDVTYENASTVYAPGKIHYNRFMNLGAAQGHARWIMFANNDLIFHDGWLHKLLAAGHPVVSPKEPRDGRQVDITKNTIGDVTGRHLSGWAFAMTRELWERIGHLSEVVEWWFSDDVVIEQCRAAGVLPMLVVDSVVEHLGSRTLNTQPEPVRDDLTWAQVEKYEKAFGEHRFSREPQYLRWKAAR